MTKFTLALGAKSIDLNISADAAKQIAAVFGGLVPAYQKVTALDTTSIAQIIELGSGKHAVGIALGRMLPPGEIEQSVFNAGVVSLKDPLSEYLELLGSGGHAKATGDEAAT